MVELLHPVMCTPNRRGLEHATVTLSEYISHLSDSQHAGTKAETTTVKYFVWLADNMLIKDKINYKKPGTHLSLASVRLL